jgi:Flp pilus assembly pilin Flp
MNSVSALAIQLLRDENGQDLIEYGLLAAIFAVAAALIFPSLIPAMGNAYTNHAVQVDNAWIPDAPLP